MGSPVHDNTTLGRRGIPIRNSLKRIVRHVELHPPAGVRGATVTEEGRRNHLLPHGYVALRIFQVAEGRHQDWVNGGHHGPEPWVWRDEHVATQAIRKFMAGGTSRHRQLDVIEAAMPIIRAELRSAENPLPPEEVLSSTEVVEDEPVAAWSPLGFTGTALAPAPTLWSDDPEIDAMSKVKVALESLDNDARKRVLQYIADRYGLEFVAVPVNRA